jgi:hypothetical protein
MTRTFGIACGRLLPVQLPLQQEESTPSCLATTPAGGVRRGGIAEPNADQRGRSIHHALRVLQRHLIRSGSVEPRTTPGRADVIPGPGSLIGYSLSSEVVPGR